MGIYRLRIDWHNYVSVAIILLTRKMSLDNKYLDVPTSSNDIFFSGI